MKRMSNLPLCQMNLAGLLNNGFRYCTSSPGTMYTISGDAHNPTARISSVRWLKPPVSVSAAIYSCVINALQMVDTSSGDRATSHCGVTSFFGDPPAINDDA